MKTKTTISEKIEEFKTIQNSFEKLNKAYDLLMDMYLNSDLSDSDVEIYALITSIEAEKDKLIAKASLISKSL